MRKMTLMLLFVLPLLNYAYSAGVETPVKTVDTTDAQASMAFIQKVEDLAKNYSVPFTKYPAHYSPTHGEEFDFIVVGAGMMGCVMANRLSEAKGWKILLLEAGDDPPFISEIPAFFSYMFDTKYDWQYKTDSNGKDCLGYKNGQCKYQRGKMLGGTYNMAFNIYDLPTEEDYKKWAALGITGWSYKDVLPYIQKTEKMVVKAVLEHSPGLHGTQGPVRLDSWVNVGTFYDYFSAGMGQLEFKQYPDLNGKDSIGLFPFQGSLENGRRVGPAKAYLSPIRDRKNLKVSKNSHVTKVIIDKATKTAIGVEFIDKEGKSIKVHAKKEVVLSAGVIGSAQILMLSGVGPKEHLEKFNISVLADLPVGKSLRDIRVYVSSLVSMNYNDPYVSQEVLLTELLKGKPNALTNGLPLSHSGVFTTDGNNNDLNGLLLPRVAKNDTATITAYCDVIFGYKDYVKAQYLEINSKSSILIPFLSHTNSKSHGSVTLISTNPLDRPKIKAGYFKEAKETDIFLSFHDFLQRLVNTSAFKQIDAKIHELRVPECEKYQYGTKDYRRCTLPYLSSETLFLTGTCPIGADNSTDAVVNNKLKVRGIKNLRVVDYSIFPLQSRMTGYGFAEKAADLVKADWPTTS